MKELPNWVFILIILLMGLALILFVFLGLPQKLIEKCKIIIRVIWGVIP